MGDRVEGDVGQAQNVGYSEMGALVIMSPGFYLHHLLQLSSLFGKQHAFFFVPPEQN